MLVLFWECSVRMNLRMRLVLAAFRLGVPSVGI